MKPPAHTYINLKQEDYDKSVYRVITFERLVELFESKRNVLVHPSMWDDPFENIFLNAIYTTDGGEQFRLAFRDHVFGQCWTLKGESDAMWRIYSANKDGVRIRTTIRKLLGSLHDTLPHDHANISCFIGKVSYYTQRQLQRINLPILDSTGVNQAKSLMIKRNAFEHEKEIRLVYCAPESSKPMQRIFNYECNPQEIISRVTFDPRMSRTMVRVFRSHLQSIGYKGIIDQSQLYTLPKEFIRKAT